MLFTVSLLMILDCQLNTSCFAAYKPYRMLEMVIALLNDELMMHLYIYTMCMTLTLRTRASCFCGKKAYLPLWYANISVELLVDRSY